MKSTAKNLKIGDQIKTSGKKRTFTLIGYWGSDLVFAPATPGETQVWIYTTSEIEDMFGNNLITKI